MLKLIKLFLSLLFLNLFNSLCAQDLSPIEWGEVPRVDLEMISFPDDTNACAVILSDCGSSAYNNRFNIEFKRHLRIKLLNQNSFEKWGTHSIDIISKDGRERLWDLEGITFNLDNDGKVVETELDDDDIFEEKLDDTYKRYRFTMPNLKPGSVIDIRYRIESEDKFKMRSWTFQYSEPVLWSDYVVTFPKCIVYANVYTGFEPWYHTELKETFQNFSGDAASILGFQRVECYQFHYTVKNAPAIREESFITTKHDYLNRVDFQLSGYSFPHTGKKEFLTDWKSYVKELIDNESFSERIDETKQVRKISAEITKDLQKPEEKLKAIYDWVANSIKWTEEYGKYTDKDVDDVIKQKKGSIEEIHFLLLSILRASGIECDPVILSTRSHGKIYDIYPIDEQFNYVIARAKIGTEYYFLDASDPLRPYDLLPKRILGVKGLVIKEPFEWVSITTDKRNNDNSIIYVSLNPDGSFTGSIDVSLSEYDGHSLRGDLQTKKDIELVKELFKSESKGLIIDSVQISNRDSIEAPLRVKGWISSSSYAQKSGDLIYMNPFVVNRIESNPFKAQIRKYPVDFGYKRGNKMIINIILPEGYELKEAVQSKAGSIGKNISYSCQVMPSGNTVMVSSKLDIKESVIQPQDYEQLKSLYSLMISAQSLQLVIGPKALTAGGEGSVNTGNSNNSTEGSAIK